MIETAITMNPDGTPEQLSNTVQLAESLGFDTCYLADQGFTRDLYVTLAMLALQTDKIKLGPGITHPYTRHPVSAAVSIATIDEISGGRAFLGLGAGGSRSLVPMQISRNRPLLACRESAEIARLLWQGSAVNYNGQMFQLQDAQIGFTCRPDIQIHWAARGPKMLVLGGEIADVNILHAIPRFALGNVVKKVTEGSNRSGRPLDMKYSIMLVYDDESRQVARKRTVYRLVDSPPDVRAGLGLKEDQVSEMRRLVTTHGPAAAAHLVDDEILDHYVYKGDPKVCADELRALFSEYGFKGLTIEVPDPTNAESLLSYASEILNQI
jgi:5,10-methylenetetrahydromethanopterin reductase